MTGTTALIAVVIGIVLLVVRFMIRPIGGHPKRSEPRRSRNPVKPGVAWREKKGMDDA